MIAGNGRFPVLALEAAKRAGLEVVAIGIQEEASKEIEIGCRPNSHVTLVSTH